jgi:hypothetical protein
LIPLALELGKRHAQAEEIEDQDTADLAAAKE